MTSRRFARTLAVVALFTASSSLHAADTDTAAVLQQVEQSAALHKKARRQAAIKQAAMEIAREQVKKLQQQLKAAEAQVAADQQAVADATAEIQRQAERLVTLRKSLQLHQQADKLVAELRAAEQALATTQNKRTELESRQSDLAVQKQNTEKKLQQLATDKAGNAEAVKAQLMELATARKKLEEAGRDLAARQQDVQAAKQQLVAPQQEFDKDVRQLGTAAAAVKKAQASLSALNKTRNTIRSAAEAAGMDPGEVTGELDESIAGVQMLVAKAEQALARAKERQQAAQQTVDAAAARLAKAEQQLHQQQTKQSALSRDHFQRQLKIADLQNAERRIVMDTQSANDTLASLTQEQQAVQEALTKNGEDISRQEQDVSTRRQAAEAGLQKAGRRISFSRQIAPILVSRCVSCHGDKPAGGLHLNSFAGLRRGGQSGSLLTASGHSPLWAAIDSGAMPKDQDPLSAAERRLFRQWLDDGAINDSPRDETASLYDVVPEKRQPAAPADYRVALPVTSLAFHPDGDRLATAGQNEVLIWNTAGELQQRIGNVAEVVNDTAFSRDGQSLFAAASIPGHYGEVKMFATETGQLMQTLLRRAEAVLAIALSPDGQTLAVALASGEVGLLDIATAALQPLPQHADWVTDINWSPDGTHIVTACRDQRVRVFAVADGRLICEFSGHQQPVYSAAFSPDGQQIVSAGSDHTARVSALSTGEQIRVIEDFQSDVFRVLVTADNRVLTASADRTARCHSLDGTIIHDFAGHQDWVYSMDFHPGDRLLATGSYDGQVRLWNAADGSLHGEFSVQPTATP